MFALNWLTGFRGEDFKTFFPIGSYVKTTGLKISFEMILKLILHNCTNEESYFYLKSCYHVRSSLTVRGDIIV